jgi:phosphoribosylformylglycinamidine synthase
LLGDAVPVLDGSEYLDVIHGRVAGRLREPDLPAVARTLRCVREAVAAGLLASAHDCAEGGMAVALAESCVHSGMGARVAAGASNRPDTALFGEAIGRVVASVKSARMSELKDFARRFGVTVRVLGTAGGNRLVIGHGDAVGASTEAGAPWIDVPVAALAEAWDGNGEVS